MAIGTFKLPSGGGINVSDADAAVGDVLSGKTFYAGTSSKKTGTMTDNGTVSTDISAKATEVTIAAGKHSGSGKVKIAQAEQDKIIAGNIKKDITILGVTGTLQSGTTTTWTKPADWIDISSVGNNEINLLVTEGTGVAFAVTVASSGTYSIDWGDGTVETSRSSETTYQHQHTTGGTPWSQGGNTYKIRIYGASSTITRFQVKRHTYTNRAQYSPILWAVFGTTGITTYYSTFYSSNLYCRDLQACTIPSFASVTNVSYMFQYCSALTSITLPTSWGSVTNVSYMFSYCSALPSITLPTSWGSVTNVSSMFYNCYALTSITLPTLWGSITDVSYMFSYCYALPSITLPTSWGSVTNVSYMFQYCSALTSITLPTLWGSVTNVSSMFKYCYSIKTINNLNYLGSTGSACDFTDFLRDCEFLQSSVSIDSLISAIGIYGASGYVLKVSSIRLTNASSTFGGSSPQINVSYTSLNAAALNALFGDLPTVSGKTINITGCTGASTCTKSIATGKGWTVTG